MASILVVGGAGYVGAATSAWLIDQGHEVWVLDNLSTGHLETTLSHRFVRGNAGDSALLDVLFQSKKFDCVMHFAAKSIVSESVSKPEIYFENNVNQTRVLLESMLKHGIHRFVFSSTCAVFGDPGDSDIDENLQKKPLNPYGESKRKAEEMIADLARTTPLQAVILRYFNAAGAEPSLRTGEWHEPETHLIPTVLKAASQGTPVTVFGTDYPTGDGTCVRDYIHVTDLARIHEKAMFHMTKFPKDEKGDPKGHVQSFNLGSEAGFSVLEIIRACEKVLGKKIEVVNGEKRAGDPPRLVANSSQARMTFGFKPEHGLEAIIKTAAAWEKKRSSKTKAVFLDRDGTINPDPGYIREPDQLELLPGVGEALKALQTEGYQLVVVSNQSGVGRGMIPKENIPKINAKLDQLLEPFAAKISHYELCFHKPDDDCDCRKPKPKLLIDAASKLGVELSRSFMVGDKVSDIEAGINAACKGVLLVRTGYGLDSESKIEQSPPLKEKMTYVGDSLREAAQWILQNGKS